MSCSSTRSSENNRKPLIAAAALLLCLTPAFAQNAQPSPEEQQQTQGQPQYQDQTQPQAQDQGQYQPQAQDQGQYQPPAQPTEYPTAHQTQAQAQAAAQQQQQDSAAQDAQPVPYAQQPQSQDQDNTQLPPPQPPQRATYDRRPLEVTPAVLPRAEASAYPVYREQQQLSIGAKLLSNKEVEQKFSTPLGKHYLVVEVGVFPANAQTVRVRPQDFTLRAASSEDQAFFPATPEDIVSSISRRGPRYIGFYPGGGVGYGSGPWGRGVSTEGGVGVGPGGRPYPRGGNGRVMENELRDKSLPNASLTQPAAGYLYFPIDGKRAKQYTLELTRNGQTISLALPDPKK
jgi:hypothetical protein